MRQHPQDPTSPAAAPETQPGQLWTELGSRLLRLLTQCRVRWWKRLLIGTFIRHFSIPLDEAAQPDAEAYPDFNAFFTRALRPGARPLAAAPALLCPVDGRLVTSGQAGVEGLLAVKGQPFTWSGVCTREPGTGPAGSTSPAGFFDPTALFFNLYLAPENYHRVHLPAAGTLRRAEWIPGRFASVRPARLRRNPDLYLENERIILEFDTHHGPLLLVLVAARLVGGIETVWCPPRTTRRNHDPAFHLKLQSAVGRSWGRGQEIARFNFGSTVILLVPGSLWSPCDRTDRVRLGQALAWPSPVSSLTRRAHLCTPRGA